MSLEEKDYPFIMEKDIAMDKAVSNLLLATLNLDKEKQIGSLKQKITFSESGGKSRLLRFYIGNDYLSFIEFSIYSKEIHLEKFSNSNCLFDSDFICSGYFNLFEKEALFFSKMKLPFLGVAIIEKFIDYVKYKFPQTRYIILSSIEYEKTLNFYRKTLEYEKKKGNIKGWREIMNELFEIKLS